MSLQVGINLLTFDSEAITGVGYFFKRLFESLPPVDDIEFTFFCQRSFEPERVIHTPIGVKVWRENVPDFKSKAARVLYEQAVLPFRCRKMAVLFSPCVANPAFKLNYRTITTIHDLTPFMVRKKYGALQSAYVRWITRLLAHSSDSIVTTSANSMSDIVRVFGVPKPRIRVIYNIATPHDASEVRYEPYFLTVATRQPAKNLKGVILSFAVFCKKYDTENHRLVIVGAKGRESNEESLAASLGIGDRVDFKGYISEEELNRLYAHCKGHITLSFYEGFGIPILEALSWQKPSVFSNVSSLPEVAGKTGIAVHPEDSEEAGKALKAIAEDPKRYLTGSEQQLDKFSASRQAAEFLSVIGQTIPWGRDRSM